MGGVFGRAGSRVELRLRNAPGGAVNGWARGPSSAGSRRVVVSAAFAFLSEGAVEFGQGQGIDDVTGFQPAFAGHTHAELEIGDVLAAVCVRAEDAADALAEGGGPVAPVQVEPAWVAVEFDPGAGFSTGLNNGGEIDGVRVAFEEESAGGMADGVDEAVLSGADEAFGVFGFVVGGDVEAGDDKIQLGQEVIVEVESIAEDVDLGTGQESEVVALVFEPAIEVPDGADLLAQSFRVKSVGLEGGAGVVGDGPVSQAERSGQVEGFLEGHVAIAPGGVVVEGTLEVGPFEQARDGPFFGGFELAQIFPQFGWDEVEAELLEDFGFVATGDEEFGIAGFFLGSEQAVFVESEATFDGAVTHDDVVLLAAREIHLGEGKFAVGHDAEVGLEATFQQDAGFGFAFGQDLGDTGLAGEIVKDADGMFAGGQKVQVANDFLAAAETAGGAAANDIGMLAEEVEEGFGRVPGVKQEVLTGVLPAALDALEEVGLGFFAEAGEGGDLACLAGFFEGLNRFDGEFFAEGEDAFGAETRDFEQFDQSGGNGSFEFFVVAEASGGDELGNFVAEAFADALDLVEALFGHDLFQGFVEVFDGAGGVQVGAGFEGVFTLEFKQGADLGQDGGDLFLVHRVRGCGGAGGGAKVEAVGSSQGAPEGSDVSIHRRVRAV